MKTLILVPALLALGLASGAAQAQDASAEWTKSLEAGDWALAAENADAVVFAKEPTPKFSPQGFHRISVRFEFSAAQAPAGAKPYLSTLVLTEFDCAQHLTRNVQATSFSGHNLSGPLSDPQQGPPDWTPVEDGSIAAILEKDACAD
jgi:hypothetical protein